MRRRTWVIAAVVILASAGGAAWLRSRSEKSDAPRYRTEKVARGDVRVQVSATGTLEALTTVLVGSQVSGTISALYADFNDDVKKNQVLAQLDPTFLRAQEEETRANLQRVEAQLRQAVRDSARVFALGAKGLAAQSEQDQAQTAVETARANVHSARAALDRAETNSHYATIYSPIDGVVISRDVDVGQTVAASLSAPTLFTIAQDLTQMQLEAAVDEADIGQVRDGQAVTFTVDAHPRSTFAGLVHQIRLAPEIVQNVVTYRVVIHVSNPDRLLLPGMTANVTILIDEVKDVLRVPAAALRFRPDGGQRPERPRGGALAQTSGAPRAERGDAARVFVLEAERPRPIRVRPGLSDGTYTAVESDSLAVGMDVIIGLDAASGASATQQGTVNPFAPQMPGGRRGR